MEKLLYILPNYLSRLLVHEELDDKSKEEIKKLRTLIKKDEFKPHDLL